MIIHIFQAVIRALYCDFIGGSVLQLCISLKLNHSSCDFILSNLDVGL